MIGPLDEYPIHQAPLPINRPTSSDRNFYDRCYFNAMDTASGDLMLVTGIGYYPNLGVKDAYVLLRRGQTQTAVHLSDAIDQNRLDQRVGAYRLEVIEPLQKIRLVLEETEGLGMDITWDGSHPVVQELPHLMLSSETRPTLDAQRFAQLGSWTGTLLVDGEEITVDPAHWMGSRDRSWGIRPVGEGEPAGRPQEPPMEGFWWLYVPMRFETFSIVVIMQEHPNGFRTLNDCTRIWHADGRVEQLGWPRIEFDYTPGTRHPERARITGTNPDGSPVVVEVETRTHAVLHVGGGYGGDPDWTHGQWKGENFVERLSYDMTSPEILGRSAFGVIDHMARATCDGETGHGLFEHASFGRHDPTGFADWSNDRA